MDWLSNPNFLNGLGVVGTWTLIGMALIFDKGISLKREVTSRDKTIEWQRLTIAEKDAHIADLVLGSRVTATALDKVADAAAAIRGNGL